MVYEAQKQLHGGCCSLALSRESRQLPSLPAYRAATTATENIKALKVQNPRPHCSSFIAVGVASLV